MTQIAFQGEVQLLRWSKTSNAGATVTFQLADAVDLERFETMTLAKKGMVGQRLAVVMVEIGDDELPKVGATAEPASDIASQDIPESKQGGSAPVEKRGMLCIMACSFSKSADFQKSIGAKTEAEARQFILDACEIESRKVLDTSLVAAEKFHLHVRKPFVAWRDAQ